MAKEVSVLNQQNGYLPRLSRACYQADAAIFWTLTLAGRAQGWLTHSFHSAFRESMLHAAARENMLRDSERQRGALQKVCFYILDNPVRADLVEEWTQWPFFGALVPGYPTLDPRHDRFWEIYWTRYAEQRDPRCDQHVRPAH